MRTLAALLGISVVVPPSLALAYQADLVPASRRVEAAEISGSISITGADGLVRVRIEGVNDANGDSLDSNRVSVRMKLRVNGSVRRVTIPLIVEGGDGETSQSLGLVEDDKVAVTDVRVRGPNHRTLAHAGVVAVEPAVTPEPPGPPPTPSECPAALEECQSDLTDCADDLAICEDLG